MQIEPPYEINDSVCHVLNNKLVGLVIDWTYSRRSNSFHFIVTFGPGTATVKLDEKELQKAEK